jgi:hypothetical protein
VFGSLFLTPAVTVIGEALASAHADGPIAVFGHPKLARALAAAGRDVVAAEGAPPTHRALAAVIGVGAASRADGDASLAAWSGAVKDGGAIVMVDRARAPEASRRALCGGLTELEQRRAGRFVITSGLVTHL